MSKVYRIAKEVIDNKWGSGLERKRRLEDAGFDYYEVQRMVNDIILNGYVEEETPEFDEDEFLTVDIDLSKYRGLKINFI